MNPDKATGKSWNWVILFLVIAILLGGLVIWSKYAPAEPLEISLVPEPEGEIYVGGAVRNPGWYPVSSGDSLHDVVGAAGGAAEGADLNRLELNIPGTSEVDLSQKVDINRAEAWLLQVLPGIGETTAQAIVDYRRKNGLFNSIEYLTNVPGIGQATLEKIKDLITVSD